VTLGQHGELTADEARKRAAKAIQRIKGGLDAVLANRPTEPPTVADLAERYLRVHVAPSCKPKTTESYNNAISRHILPALGTMALKAVAQRHAVALHRALADRPSQANITLSVLSQMFNKAMAWGWLPRENNPCCGVDRYRVWPRERFLTRAEYRRLGDVLKDAECSGWLAKPAVAAIRLLILTGCRRNEILSLRWNDVDRSAREIHLRDTKTGPQVVALTAEAERVLDGIRRAQDNPWVIAGEKPGTRRKSLTPGWRKVRARAGLHDVRLHDLRHSYASRALAEGESLSMIGKLLNHVQIQTTARYAHLMRDAEKAAADRVGDKIDAVAGGRR